MWVDTHWVTSISPLLEVRSLAFKKTNQILLVSVSVRFNQFVINKVKDKTRPIS